MSARILVIEDNPANLELMAYLLDAFGHRPLRAVDGRQGVESARHEAPDLILCDVQLPDVSGYEVARLLKADPGLAKVPLVAVTAFAMVGDRDRLLAAGFDGYIAKPIDPPAFVGQVEAFLPSGARSAAPALSEAAPPAAPPAPPTRRVLMVDDRPVNLSLMESLLVPLGYEVVTARGVPEALALARQTRPDLIVSDVVMGGSSGYDFIREVRADPALARVPFIFLTATVCNEAARARGLALGADRFIFRPAEPQVILAAIEACLRPHGEG